MVIAIAGLGFITARAIHFFTRVRPELRRPFVQVTDFQILAHIDANPVTGHGNHNGEGRQRLTGKAGKQAGQRVIFLLSRLNLAHCCTAHAQVGKHHRHYNQVGDDDHRHPDTGRHGQFPDHTYIDDIERQETNGI